MEPLVNHPVIASSMVWKSIPINSRRMEFHKEHRTVLTVLVSKPLVVALAHFPGHPPVQLADLCNGVNDRSIHVVEEITFTINLFISTYTIPSCCFCTSFHSTVSC